MILAPLLLAASLSSAAPPTIDLQQAADTVRYTVMIGGRNAGMQKGWTEPGGVLHFTNEYNDRGRGPKIETRLRLGPDGLPSWSETTGVDYYKNPVTERFAIENGVARWSSPADSGSRRVSGPAFYVSIYGTGDFLPGLRVMLASGGELPLLPDGRATARRVGELQVSAGGRTRTVVQYLVGGFGFDPFSVWMTPEGEFFASGGEWNATVLQGWEDALPAIFEAQKRTDDTRSAELARTLPRRPSGALVFRDVGVFDPETKTVRPGQTVVVRGDRIAAVGAEGRVAVPAGAEVIDGRGKTLLPGLWDMHVHAGALDGLLHLAAGVTTVRDLGNDTTTILDLRRRWESGEAVGPRLIAAGFLDGPGQYTGPIGPKVATPEEARAAVEMYHRLGFEQIKVYSSLDPKLFPVIVEAAHARGMRVSGHIPWPMLAQDAVRQGIDELQHGNFLLLNFLGDSIDTRTPARFHAPARMAADLDLASPRVAEFVRLLKERDIVVDPTLAAFEDLFVSRPGVPAPSLAAVATRMPPTVQRGILSGGLPVPEGMDARYRASHGKMMELVAMLHRAGVRLVPGTDGTAGFTLHRELELWVQAGIPAADALYAATLGSARLTKRDDRLGRVAPGMLADLVLVDGDPTRRISDIRNTRLVVKGGTVFTPDAIYAELGIAPVPARTTAR